MKHPIFSLLFLFSIGIMLPPQAVIAREIPAQTSTSEQITKEDRDFVAKASAGGVAEVKLGKLAQEKASRQDVKAFGQRMVNDHGNANKELESIAKGKGIAVSDQPSPEASKQMDKLSKLSGEEFDEAYIEVMIDDHQEDVAEFEKAAEKLNDPDLKAFAQKTLPVLKSHLESIKEIKNAKK